MKSVVCICKVFCLFFLGFSGQEVLGQRVVSIYEPMYNYDLAVKFHLSAAANEVSNSNYWLLENFKAPIGVQFIATSVAFDVFPGRRTLFVYDSQTGYLVREIHHRLDKKGLVIPNTLWGYVYEYQRTKDHLVIVKKNIANWEITNRFFFEKRTEMLVKTITAHRDSIHYHYNDQLIPKYHVVDHLEISSKNQFTYELVQHDESLFEYAELPFIYFSIAQYSTTNVGVMVLGKKPDKALQNMARKFNQLIQNRVVPDNNHIKLTFTFDVPLEKNSHFSTDGRYDIWITDHSVSRAFSSKRLLDRNIYVFDPKTKSLLEKEGFGNSVVRGENIFAAATPKYYYAN
ncbi:hypothetical protein [Flavobacterium sp. JP2137]|uniref:hypothetical protein n=1 Tax=Flavobacterium sp. JP2137 TaxID=3414510 RepID=UPI003D300FBE